MVEPQPGKGGPLVEYEQRIAAGELSRGDSCQVGNWYYEILRSQCSTSLLMLTLQFDFNLLNFLLCITIFELVCEYLHGFVYALLIFQRISLSFLQKQLLCFHYDEV